jgi:GTP cyclohydrolase I
MLKDTQSSHDDRNIPINKVGICDLRHPIAVMDRAQKQQHTIGVFSMSVDLPAHIKGTHMSRFIEVLNRHHSQVTMSTLPQILEEMRTHLEADSAQLGVTFPYFIERSAPVSGATALLDYEVEYIGEATADKQTARLRVTVPVKTLCPCSKAISDYGAHNQRGYVSMEVECERNAKGHPQMIWIEELAEVAEKSASAPLYPLLKRPDERFVTMQAFDNPVFVEDLSRNVAKCLMEDKRIASFKVAVVNQESIHNHNAFAEIAWSRQAQEEGTQSAAPGKARVNGNGRVRHGKAAAPLQ